MKACQHEEYFMSDVGKLKFHSFISGSENAFNKTWIQKDQIARGMRGKKT